LQPSIKEANRRNIEIERDLFIRDFLSVGSAGILACLGLTGAILPINELLPKAKQAGMPALPELSSGAGV